MKFYTNSTVHRGQVLYRGWDGDSRVQRRIDYEPYIFIRSEVPTGYQTISGLNVKKKSFDSIRQARDFINTYKEVDNFEYWGLTDFAYLYLFDEFSGEIQFNRSRVNVVSIDIETWIGDSGFESPYRAGNPITLITMRMNDKTYTLGTKVYYPKDPNVSYYLCKDEKELISKFIHLWKELDPDIITGWNIDKYDIPYIINRIINVFGEETAKKLSPWNIIDVREYNTKWGDKEFEYTIQGITSLDYLELYKKFSYKNQESYRLDHIAFVELNKKKLDYSEYSNLDDFYEKNFERFVEYNILDAQLVDELDAKLGYINVVLSLSYLYKCNYRDTFATVKPWDICIHAYLLNQNIVIPQNKRSFQNRELIGGYVMEVNPGVYDWVCSFDIKSSYPHQILQYNISPDTFVEKRQSSHDLLMDFFVNGTPSAASKSLDYAKEYNLFMAANGAMFRKDKMGFITSLIKQFFDERARFEKLMDENEKLYNDTKKLEYKDLAAKYNSMQYALKISINSLYGAISNEYCRWYSIDLAEAITMSGQLSVKWAMYKINAYVQKMFKSDNNFIVAGDTDSAIVGLSAIVDRLTNKDNESVCKALIKVCDQYIQVEIKNSFEELASRMGVENNKIRMARENIASRAIWTAPKHYAMNVMNSKGIQYDKPKLKIVGLEPVKSTIPMICKEKLKEAFRIILEEDNDNLLKFIDKFQKEFYTLPFSQVALPRGVSDIKKYMTNDTYIKGTPINSRAAILYNALIKKLELNLNKINDGSKMRFCYLTVPNPINENVIGAIDELPPEFGLDKYIDYDTQFDKTFLNPLDQLCQVIQWKTEDTASLEDFFN